MRKKPRLSEFIKEKLEDGTIPGLTYTDRAKQIFRIPWKHGAKQGYEIEKDGVIYVEWARVTNKYNKYHDKRNVWKTNFRCAINSLQDVKCLDDEQDKVNGKLRSDKEYRVFQFVTPEKKKINVRTPRNANKPKSHRQNTQSTSLIRKKKKCKINKYQENQSKSMTNVDTNVGSVKTESESTEGSLSNSIDEQYHESNLPFPVGGNPCHNQIYVPVPTTSAVGPSVDHFGEFRISQDENQDLVYGHYDLHEPPFVPNTCEMARGESIRSNPEYQEILSELRPSDTCEDYRSYDRWYYGDNTPNYYALHSAYVQTNVPACQGGY